jgi:hypothetical protein
MFGVRHSLDYTCASDKRIWHPLSLQSMPSREFVAVVNKILSGKYGLLTYARGHLAQN